MPNGPFSRRASLEAPLLSAEMVAAKLCTRCLPSVHLSTVRSLPDDARARKQWGCGACRWTALRLVAAAPGKPRPSPAAPTAALVSGGTKVPIISLIGLTSC